MLNDPPPQKPPPPLQEPPPSSGMAEPTEAPGSRRRLHPLERPPVAPAENTPRQQARLHIPAVQPVVTYVLLAVNIAVFVLGYFFPNFRIQLLLWGTGDPEAVLDYGEYHRLFTAMFIHIEPWHIFFNAVVLYFYGATIERIFGHTRFVVIYVLGGLAGSVLSIALGSGGYGASGALFAVFGAEYVFLHKHRKLLGEGGRARRRTLLILAAMNLLVGVLSDIGGGEVRVGNWAHLGGLIGGVALSWYISPLFVLHRLSGTEDHFIAEDVNPLLRNYWIVSLYVAVLLGILTAAVFLLR